jgi:mono/diheme cytochrome c family protein
MLKPTPSRTAAHRWAAPLLVTLLVTVGAAAQADSRNVQPQTTLPAYQQECAACHMAYPPGLLPAASWTRLMGGLDKHYGTDASLDAATVTRISGWLTAHAGTYRRVSEAPPEDRITRSAWFERKHRGIDPQVWKHVSVKSAANCVACHAQAERGNFDEDSVRLPMRSGIGFRLDSDD